MSPRLHRAVSALVGLLLAAGCLWPSPALAEFRYLLSADLRERFDSNVFAGVKAEDWDVITEVEPGLRAFYHQRTSLFWLSYTFTFQYFPRTPDPAADRQLLGYANRLFLDYIKLVTPTTGFRLYTRFAQGTENTQVLGGVNPAGGIELGYLTTGSKYITDTSRVEVQHLWSPRWSSSVQLDGSFYRAYDRSNQPRMLSLPNTFSPSLTHRLHFLLPVDVLELDTTFTALVESKSAYDRDLSTFLFDVAPSWRHYFGEFWDARLSGGINIRARQVVGAGGDLSWFDTTVGPLAAASVRYRRGREVLVALEYSHLYQLTLEFETSTSSETDQVALYSEWAPTSGWVLLGGGAFRYLRGAPRVAGASLSTTKVATASASIGYMIRPGLSVELGYHLEVVRDRPALGQTGQPGLGEPPRDHTRHLASVGLSIAWPPLPPQGSQLTHRASLNQPIFELGPGGATAAVLRAPEEGSLLTDSRAERARRARRARELGQQEPQAPVPPLEEPAQELFENPRP